MFGFLQDSIILRRNEARLAGERLHQPGKIAETFLYQF